MSFHRHDKCIYNTAQAICTAWITHLKNLLAEGELDYLSLLGPNPYARGNESTDEVYYALPTARRFRSRKHQVLLLNLKWLQLKLIAKQLSRQFYLYVKVSMRYNTKLIEWNKLSANVYKWKKFPWILASPLVAGIIFTISFCWTTVIHLCAKPPDRLLPSVLKTCAIWDRHSFSSRLLNKIMRVVDVMNEKLTLF